jgi:hypothetical protein
VPLSSSAEPDCYQCSNNSDRGRAGNSKFNWPWINGRLPGSTCSRIGDKFEDPVVVGIGDPEIPLGVESRSARTEEARLPSKPRRGRKVRLPYLHSREGSNIRNKRRPEGY